MWESAPSVPTTQNTATSTGMFCFLCFLSGKRNLLATFDRVHSEYWICNFRCIEFVSSLASTSVPPAPDICC